MRTKQRKQKKKTENKMQMICMKTRQNTFFLEMLNETKITTAKCKLLYQNVYYKINYF